MRGETSPTVGGLGGGAGTVHGDVGVAVESGGVVPAVARCPNVGGFLALATHPVEIGLRVCWWGGVAHGEPRTMSRRLPPLYIA